MKVRRGERRCLPAYYQSSFNIVHVPLFAVLFEYCIRTPSRTAVVVLLRLRLHRFGALPVAAGEGGDGYPAPPGALREGQSNPNASTTYCTPTPSIVLTLFLQTAAETSNKYGRENSHYPVMETYAEGGILEVKVVVSTYHWVRWVLTSFWDMISRLHLLLCRETRLVDCVRARASYE